MNLLKLFIVSVTLSITAQSVQAKVFPKDVMPQEIVEQIKIAIKQVKAKIKDPYSAKFGNVIVYHKFEDAMRARRETEPGYDHKSDMYNICGVVNFKNEYGAYMGDTTFYVGASGAEILGHFDGEFDSQMFIAMYKGICTMTDSDDVYAVVGQDELDIVLKK